MKKRRLKPFVKVSALLVVLLVCTIGISVLLNNNKTSSVSKMNDDFTYVNDYIFDSYYPVINQEEKITRPYSSDKVTIYKNFYDQTASEEEQENSIIYHDGIYMQNSGVTYKADEQFDVLASISGTVTNVSVYFK